MIKNPSGIFQFEGAFAFESLKKFTPKSIFDMSIVTACIRPSGASYRDALLARKPHSNPSEIIDELLKDNLGYLIYQEDTIKFLQQICGLSGSESDNIRRAIGRKQKDRLDAAMPSILEGYCEKSPQPRKVAEAEAKEFLQIIEDIETRFAGKVKPRNPQQELAIDMLYDENTTVKIIAGKFGTGKDFLMCSAAIDLLEHDKFEKIVYVRNNIEVKNSKPIGHLPGSYNEKLLPFAMPLADHLGGVDGLELMIGHGKIEIVHLGFIRGRDIKNSIIICSEAENMTKEHIQLLLGRVGEGSSLWINGDFKQCDADVFRENSGLMIAVDKLKGHPRFGYVKLLKTERSETAAMADLLD